MTDCDNSVAQNDSDEDIYQDFSEFSLEKELSKTDSSREFYKKEANDLSEKVKVLNEENKKLKDLNKVLEKNLSILLKTAQAEVKRKDSVIEELRVQIDSFTFRRNKLTKDKYTSTDNCESGIDLKHLKECKCSRESQKAITMHERSKSRSSSDNDHKSLKIEEIFFNGKSFKQGKTDCDISTKNKYCKDSANLGLRHIDDSEGHNLKYRARSHSSYRGKSSYEPYRQDCRDRLKNFTEDLNYRKRHSKKLNDSQYSSRERNIKDGSSERQKEKNRKTNRSQSHERSRSNKESSIEKHRNTRLSIEKDSKTCGRDHKNKKKRHSERTKYAEKREESSVLCLKNKEQNRQKLKENFSEKHWSNDKNTAQIIDRKSPLDALYDEAQLNSIQEQCELEKDKSENNYSSPPSIQEDWILSFKNERKNDAKPMTLYSKRMMQKFSLESKVQENKNLKSIEINQNQNIISEKEPGELTDDESEIEKSKEFQEVAKAAVFESKVFDKKPVVEREKFLKDNLNQESFGNDFLMAEPEKIKSKPFSENLAKDTVLSESQTISSQEKLILEKKIDCSKEAREVIEFSPFKNNYKLIEISPVKASESIRLLEEHNNKLIVNSDAQRQVEASVFNLLSSLSGVPVDINGHENHSEKFKLENNNTQVPTVEINKTLDKPDEVQCESLNDKQGETDEPLKFFEEKKNVCQLQNVFSSKNFKKKNNLFQKAIDKNHEKEEEKKISSVKDVKNVENSAEVSGTSQFLDFFLLTSSPNPKPVLAAEEEKSITNLQKKNIFDSSNQKSDENVILGSQAEVKESEQKVTKTFSYNDSKSKKRKDSFARDTQIKGPEKINEKNDENLAEVQKKNEKLLKLKNNKRKEIECKSAESNLGGDKKKLIKNENEEAKDEKNKRKRKLSECDGEMPMEKKTKLDRNERSKETTIDLINVLEEEEQKGEQRKVKEDISFFEFFKPITKKEGTETEKIGIGEVPSTTDFKMTRTMSLTGVLHLETPSKCVEKLKNVMINEQTIYQVLDSKNNNSSFSPLIGAKLVEMTPRRLLKNDLMLTDSEDDSVLRLNQEDEGLEQGDGDNGEISQSENSECESDSGASAFVDLL